jgi:hypothetical protein
MVRQRSNTFLLGMAAFSYRAVSSERILAADDTTQQAFDGGPNRLPASVVSGSTLLGITQHGIHAP